LVSIGQLVRQIVRCTSTLAAWLGGSQDDRLTHAMVGLAKDIDRIFSFQAKWLAEIAGPMLQWLMHKTNTSCIIR